MQANSSSTPTTLDVLVTRLVRDNTPTKLFSHASQPVLLLCKNIDPPYYRFLYKRVGKDYDWVERLTVSDEILAQMIQKPSVHIFVMMLGGAPAGYFEIEEGTDNDSYLQYFGLFPQYIGQGLGPWLLNQAIHSMVHQGAERIFVETCDRDHPKALMTYQRAGFQPMGREHRQITIPYQYEGNEHG